MTLFETLAVKDGVINNLAYHNVRFIQGQKYLKAKRIKNIADVVYQNSVPCDRLMRCKVIYDNSRTDVEFFPYQPRAIRSFKLVYDDGIDYAYKATDRTAIDRLFAQRGDCDDIIIIKNGYVTDCSIGNLLFFKNGRWLTPDTPLLYGTQRGYLLDKGVIDEAVITACDVKDFEYVMMVNVLNGFDERRAVAVSGVF